MKVPKIFPPLLLLILFVLSVIIFISSKPPSIQHTYASDTISTYNSRSEEVIDNEWMWLLPLLGLPFITVLKRDSDEDDAHLWPNEDDDHKERRVLSSKSVGAL